jgi:ApaG protein
MCAAGVKGGMYSATTQGIRVSVEPKFLEDQSDTKANRFFWAYRIEIENTCGKPVQLIARHWIITDGNGRREDVRGIGVVGEQPIIDPGSSFTYTSGCPLKTPSGIMAGTYQMVDNDGEILEVTIPAFSLDVPDQRRILN